MVKLELIALALATSICPVLSLPPSRSYYSDSGTKLSSIGPRDAAPSSVDYSKIKKLAAIGESYAAGIGARKRLGGLSDLGAYACSRYDGAYGYLLSKSPRFGDSPPKFQFDACSGATLNKIRDEQVDRLDGDQDVILISGGGNDVGFLDVLNQCVYQIFAPTAGAVRLMKDVQEFSKLPLGDLEKYGRTCKEVLQDVDKYVMDNPKFESDIKSLVEKAKTKLAKNGVILWTGYAPFWAVDAKEGDLDACSNVNWSVFLSNAGDKLAFQDPKDVELTIARRKAMNSMIDKVNSKISLILGNAGENVVFVDIASEFSKSDGLFCKGDVKEPDPKRSNLLFYELDTKDPFGTTKRDGDLYKGTFEYDIDTLGELAAQAGSRLDNPIEKGSKTDDSKKRMSNWLPDGYGRVFHPTQEGHELILEQVVKALDGLLEPSSPTSSTTDLPKSSPTSSSHGGNQCRLPSATGVTNSKAKCDADESSGLPAKVFKDMFGDFCKEVGSDHPSNTAWQVDYQGKKKAVVRRDLQSRSPPVNPESYKGASAYLSFKKKDGDVECKMTCTDAYNYMAQSLCGRTGGEQRAMSKSGHIDAGCGVYAFYAYDGSDEGQPKRWANVKDPVCLKNPGMPDSLDPRDVWGVYIAATADEQENFCNGDQLNQQMGPASDPIAKTSHPSVNGKPLPLHVSISWIEGCTSSSAQDPKRPLAGWGNDISCKKLLGKAHWCGHENQNIGGGYIDAGCLRYQMGVPSNLDARNLEKRGRPSTLRKQLWEEADMTLTADGSRAKGYWATFPVAAGKFTLREMNGEADTIVFAVSDSGFYTLRIPFEMQDMIYGKRGETFQYLEEQEPDRDEHGQWRDAQGLYHDDPPPNRNDQEQHFETTEDEVIAKIKDSATFKWFFLQTAFGECPDESQKPDEKYIKNDAWLNPGGSTFTDFMADSFQNGHIVTTIDFWTRSRKGRIAKAPLIKAFMEAFQERSHLIPNTVPLRAEAASKNDQLRRGMVYRRIVTEDHQIQSDLWFGSKRVLEHS